MSHNVTDSIEHKRAALSVVGGANDEKTLVARKLCRELRDALSRFGSGAEKSFKPGMLVQWKPGMKNRTGIGYCEPRIVMEILDPPIIDTKFDSGSCYFRERLDIVLGYLDEDNELLAHHADSRRFELYTGPGLGG